MGLGGLNSKGGGEGNLVDENGKCNFKRNV